jgi:hypothetical protein
LVGFERVAIEYCVVTHDIDIGMVPDRVPLEVLVHVADEFTNAVDLCLSGRIRDQQH